MRFIHRHHYKTVRIMGDDILLPHDDRMQPHLLETAQMVTRFYDSRSIPGMDLTGNRERLCQAACAKRERALQQFLRVKNRRFTKSRNKWMWQFAAALVVATLMLFPLRGQMTVSAKDSLPGDALYLLKLASEESTVEVIEDPGIKTLLTLSFVDRRIDEITKLAQAGREIPLPAIYRAHRLLNTALGYAAWVADDDMPAVLEELIQHIQAYVHALEQAKTENADENYLRLIDLQGRCLRLQLIATAASIEPGVFRDAYRAGTPERLTALSDPLGGDPALVN